MTAAAAASGGGMTAAGTTATAIGATGLLCDGLQGVGRKLSPIRGWWSRVIWRRRKRRRRKGRMRERMVGLVPWSLMNHRDGGDVYCHVQLGQLLSTWSRGWLIFLVMEDTNLSHGGVEGCWKGRGQCRRMLGGGGGGGVGHAYDTGILKDRE